MNPATGTVDTEENWRADMDDFGAEMVSAKEQLEQLVEVAKNKLGVWVESS